MNSSDDDKRFESLLAESLREDERERIYHPEIGILAGYFERQLSGSDRTGVEAHLATCGRCREIVHDLGRISEPKRPSAFAWLPRLTPAFGALATATVAVVLAIRFFPDTQRKDLSRAPFSQESREEAARFREVLPERGGGASPSGAGEKQGQLRAGRDEKKSANEIVAKASKPAVKSGARADALRDEESDGSADLRRQAPAKEANLERAKDAPARAVAPEGAGGSLGAAAATPPPRTANEGAESERENVAEAPEPSATADAAKADAFLALQKTRDETRASATTLPAEPTPPASAPAPASEVGAAAGAAVTTTRAAQEPKSESVAALDDGDDTPAAPFLWRLGPDGLERSGDDGSTWATVEVPTPSRILALSVPKPGVAWVVGEGGTVLRTIDGRTWERLESPTDEDIVSIYARNAESATVTTRSGRTLETETGATWQTR